MLRYYIIIICTAVGLIALGNALFAPIIPIWYALCGPILATLAIILLDAVIAIATRALPKKWLLPTRKIYTVSKKERKFWDKLKIRKWKDKVPEMGRYLCHFDKTKVTENSSAYVLKFLYETTMAGVMHFFSAFLGFLLLLIPVPGVWTITLPVVLVNFVLQIPPILIQRYNRPKLFAHYARLKKIESKTCAVED